MCLRGGFGSEMNHSNILTVFGIAVIMLVIGVAIGSVAFPMTKTETMTQLSNVTATQTLVRNVSQTVTQTQLDIIPCTSVYPNGTAPPDMPVIFARQNSTVFVCVKYYYYNATSPETFNTSLLSAGIFGATYESTYPPHINFRISAFPTNITLGGISNLNEGALVTYGISTGDTSNGTYVLNLSTWLYPSLEACGGFTKFIVNNPNPNYAFFGSCTAPLSNFYPLNSYGFVDGFLTADVVGTSNST